MCPFFLQACTHLATSPLIPLLGTQHSPAFIITTNLLNEQQAAQIIIILMAFMVMGWCVSSSGEEWKWTGAEDCYRGQVLNLFQYLIAADSLGASLHPFTLCFSPSLLCPHQEAAGLGKRVMVVDRVAAALSSTVPGEQHGARVTAKPVKSSPIFILLCSFFFFFFAMLISFSIFVPCTSFAFAFLFLPLYLLNLSSSSLHL